MTLELPLADRASIDATRTALAAVDPAFPRAVDPLLLGYDLCVAAANDQSPSELRDIVRGEVARIAATLAATAARYRLTDETADQVVATYKEHYCGGIDPAELD